MQLKLQKKIAAEIKKCSPSRIKLDPESLEEIKEAITKKDIKGLIEGGVIKVMQKKGTSRVRAKKRKAQKVKGKRKGPGSRKGKKGARLPKKETWMNRIRKQKKFLKGLRDKEMVTRPVFRMLYMKAKGGFFRSLRHIKTYLNEHKLIKQTIK